MWPFDGQNFLVKTWTDLLRPLCAVQIPGENSEFDENCGHGLEGLPELFHLQKLTLKIRLEMRYHKENSHIFSNLPAYIFYLSFSNLKSIQY